MFSVCMCVPTYGVGLPLLLGSGIDVRLLFFQKLRAKKGASVRSSERTSIIRLYCLECEGYMNG